MEVFNPVYDKIALNDLSPELQALIRDSSESVSYNLNRHMKDKSAHITVLDRETWNNKAPNFFHCKVLFHFLILHID